MKKMKILIIQPKKLGDVVLTTPVIEILHQHFLKKNFDVKIDFLVEEPFQEILINNPFLNKIYILNKKKWTLGEKSFLSVLFKVRKEKYDYIFDFFGNPTTAYITFFSKAKNTYSFDYRARKYLYKHVFPRNITKNMYIVDFKLSLLQDLEIEKKEVKPNIYLEDKIIKEKKEIIKNNGYIETDKIIGIVVPNVRERNLVKNWIFDRYYILADKLINDLNAFIILLTGPGEEKNAIKIKENISNKTKVFITPIGNIRDIAGYIKNCDCIFSTCSGDKHIAVSLEIPTVTIFGPSNYKSFNPLDYEKYPPVFSENLECLACELNKCPKDSQKCMEDITVDIVFEKIKKLLKEVCYENNKIGKI